MAAGPTRFLLIGSSHLHALIEGIAARASVLQNSYAFRQLTNVRADSRVVIWDDPPRFLPEVEVMLAEIAAFDKLVLAVGGSSYLGFCLNDEDPYDFEMPGLPDLPNGVRVPFAEVKAALALKIRYVTVALALTAAASTIPVYCLESPPPVGDNDFILDHQHWAAWAFEKAAPSPPLLRLKFWRLHSEIVRQACAEADISFIPVPPETIGPDGLLAPRAYGVDMIHANAWYGERVLRQLEALARESAP